MLSAVLRPAVEQSARYVKSAVSWLADACARFINLALAEKIGVFVSAGISAADISVYGLKPHGTD
jgi:hypothetical protein